MFTHKVQRAYIDSSSVKVLSEETVTADGELNFDGSITGSDQAVSFACTQANLKALLLYSSKACTIETNSSSVPQDTITLAADQVIIWTLAQDGLPACPFSDNVTAVYVTVPSGTASVKIRALTDITP